MLAGILPKAGVLLETVLFCVVLLFCASSWLTLSCPMLAAGLFIVDEVLLEVDDEVK